jgi:Phospholipase_D-nuclease N-terminal
MQHSAYARRGDRPGRRLYSSMARRALSPLALAALSACTVSVPGVLYVSPYRWHFHVIATLLLIADLWACYHIWRGKRGLVSKLLWTLLVWCFPVGGLIFFWIFGDRVTA